ncbi:glycosyltransferase [Flavobacterium marginilacus]|uniref:glycosyltransferase n=1 Tax=Flavobacterium marginilacus TaxID=3003256 RepID=UPI00248E81A6|nr:glycosyltransferase [Flavobacterium marginilacus]
MRVALVQDWLTEMGGAEKVFASIHSLYPDADIFTLVANDDILEKLNIDKSKVTTSFIQRLPGCPKRYRNYFPLFKYGIEEFDLSSYDLVISSSYCVAKGVLTNHNQVHISYCHSPVRYAWDLHHKYIKEANLESGFKGMIAKYFLHHLRIWDIASSNRVDHFIANSNFIASRINKIYRRKSDTIYPPVDVDAFTLQTNKENFYITCSRLVPYKKVDLIVDAFSKMPDKELVVIGDGPEFKKLNKVVSSLPNIKMLGYQSFEVLKEKMAKAKAFVFAAEEDFGIVPVEAQACGTPVIAYGKGGSLETVKHGLTGILFKEQTSDSIIVAVEEFEQLSFDPVIIRTHAESFSTEIFNNSFLSFVKEKIVTV